MIMQYFADKFQNNEMICNKCNTDKKEDGKRGNQLGSRGYQLLNKIIPNRC